MGLERKFSGSSRKEREIGVVDNIVHLEHVKLSPDAWRYVKCRHGSWAVQTWWVYLTALAKSY